MLRRDWLKSLWLPLFALVWPKHEAEPEQRGSWFCLDCCGDYHEFDTQAEALKFAEEDIELCCDGEWAEEVEKIRVGYFTHWSEQCDVVKAEQLDEDGCFNGRYYGGLHDYWCNYKMHPLT